MTDVVKDCEFAVFKGAIENGGTVRGINAKGQGGMPRKKIDKLVSFAKDFGAKGLAYIAIQEDGTVKSSFAKFMKEEEMSALIEAMEGEAGDLLLFAADKNKVVWDVAGRTSGWSWPVRWSFWTRTSTSSCGSPSSRCWSGARKQNRFTAMHHPFTMPMEEDLAYIDSDPGRVRAKAYDIVLNGNEIGGGSVRIFNPEIQSKMFEVLGFTEEQAQAQFGFLLDCIQVRSAASRRAGLRTGPSGDADGERRQHTGRDRIPQGERCLRPYDRGSGQSDEGAA